MKISHEPHLEKVLARMLLRSRPERPNAHHVRALHFLQVRYDLVHWRTAPHNFLTPVSRECIHPGRVRCLPIRVEFCAFFVGKMGKKVYSRNPFLGERLVRVSVDGPVILVHETGPVIRHLDAIVVPMQMDGNEIDLQVSAWTKYQQNVSLYVGFGGSLG